MQKHSYWVMSLYSILGGLITAYAYAISLDRKIDIFVLTLPAVFPFASIGGIIGGILVSPLMYYCLKDKALSLALPIVYLFVSITTIGFNLVVAFNSEAVLNLGIPRFFFVLCYFIPVVVILFICKKFLI